MHDIELLKIMAVGLSAALGLGYLTHRLKLSPIVGYLLAGFIVGPFSPGFVADQHLAAQLAEVGVILLMFGVGLHFDLKDLLAVKAIALPGAIGQSLVATLLGALIGVGFAMTLGAGLVLGLGVSVASTVVLMRVLMDNELLDTVHGHVAVGWLIVEDIFTVLVLVLMPAFAAAFAGNAGDAGSGMLASGGMAVLKLIGFGLMMLFIGGRLVPWLMTHVARARSRELFTLTVLALAFVIAVGSSVLFGASIALGAFVAGMVVGRTEVSHQAAADVLPMRDAFAVLFFLSVGMLFDPRFIFANPWLVLAILGVILLAKPLAACLIVIGLGYSVRTALVVAIGLAQIGEFSFILAQQAQLLNLLPQAGYSVLVVCALISIALNPLLFKMLDPLERALRRRKTLWRLLNRRSERRGLDANAMTRNMLAQPGADSRAIVVGYGPVGQRVASLLRESNVPTVIIDMNVDTVSGLVAEGHAAVYGDGSHRDILKDAGIAQARFLLITLPEIAGTIAVIINARHLNPEIKILVRARYLGSQPMLESLGVTAISFEEEEVAKAMTEVLMQEVR